MLERLGRISLLTQWLVVLGFCAIFFFIWPTHVPLTEVDEARFTEATREMLESGNYVIPFCNYVPRYQKPVLIYWMQAASARAFGMNEAAARFPSAVAGVAVVSMLFIFLRRNIVPEFAGDDKSRSDRARGAAFAAAVAMTAVPYVAIYSRAAVADSVLTLWITCTLGCMLLADLKHTAAPNAKGKFYVLYLLAAVFAGLGVMTKGPLGIAIPGAVWLVYHIKQRDLRAAAARVPWLAAVAVFLLVAVPWYAATYFYKGPGGGPGFLQWFFLKEHVQRFSTTMQGHGGGSGISGRLQAFVAYPLMFLLLAFPLSAYVVNELRTPFGGSSALGENTVLRRTRTFAFTWLVTVIVALSLAKTVMPEYIHSIIGAAGLLFALHLMGRLEPAKNRKPVLRGLETALLVVFGLLWTSAVVYVLKSPAKIEGRLGDIPFPQPLTTLLMAIIAVAGVAMVLSTLLRDEERRLRFTIGAWMILFAVTMLGAAPIIVRRIYTPTVTAGDYLRALPRSEPMICYAGRDPEGLVFYARRQIVFTRTGKLADKVGSQYDVDFMMHVEDALKESSSVVVVTNDVGLSRMQMMGFRDFESIGPPGRLAFIRLTSTRK